MYYVSRVLGAFSALGLAWAAVYAIQFARAGEAFREGTPEAVARAVRLEPENAALLSLRALQLEYDGSDPRALLERLAALNPLSSAPRIRLGLNAEARGDSQEAERWLLAAAQVDRQFEPAWTLANFYFRQQRMEPFWKWMRAALTVSYGDRRPAFDLCWRAASDPADIFSRAIPDRREVVAAYLEYLIDPESPDRLQAALPVALKLADGHEPEDLPLLYRSCDRWLNSGDSSAAAQVWVALGFPAPDGITHPDFEKPRLGHGFDWREISSAGVTHLEEDSPSAHRILFSGDQPENCGLLRQFVMVQPGRKYVLRWESRGSGFPRESGLEWRAGDARAPVAAADQWTPGHLTFESTKSMLPLVFAYGRPLGEVRVEGWVELRHVTLQESAP